MRIAVSGSHCTGKSTLIDEFLRVHPDFVHEPEPYTILVDEFGEEFAAEPCVDDFLRQLEFNIERLKQHVRGKRVIYERCPIDFLAYIDALDAKSAAPVIGQISHAIQDLELIVYLPLDNDIGGDSEFPKLRKAVDRRLGAIYGEDEFGIIGSANVVVVEARGSTQQRLRTVEAALLGWPPDAT